MTLFKRIFKAGIIGFYRNRTVSLSSIFILTITLILIASLFFFNAVFNYSINQIKSKVDISIYFKPNADENNIEYIKEYIKKFPEVAKIEYISKEKALEDFKELHKNDEITLEALKELNENPFGSSISIKAKDTNFYDDIMSKINKENLGENYNVIDTINYADIKNSIDRLTNIISWLSNMGYIIALIFIIMSIMIIYNTIRIAIFVFREEISIMKLVGASNFYIRGPFVVESAIYGLISTILAIIILYPITSWISKKTLIFFEGFDIHKYYLDNIYTLFFMLLFVAVVVSCISSALAIRKYLKI